jgi:hypothetical protein
VIVTAALCASPPLLHPALTGRAVVLPELHAACAEAVARLLRSGPELVVVVGPAPGSGEWDPDERFDPEAFAPGVISGRVSSGRISSGRVVSGYAGSGDTAADGAGSDDVGPVGAGAAGAGAAGAGRGALPLSLGLGAMLLDQGGYSGPRRLIAVGQAEPTGTCAALGAELATGAPRTALLVMGDGSARRTLKAPGHLDSRAEPFDAQVERAVRAGWLGALLDLDEALARDLMVTGRPAWQVLAGAMPDGAGADNVEANGAPATEVLYRDDPFGVAYLVACLQAHPGS